MEEIVYTASDGRAMTKDDVIFMVKEHMRSGCGWTFDQITGGEGEFFSYDFYHGIKSQFEYIIMNFNIVKYTGPFGYIKPWSAVRDELTFSQLYLTGSILKGMSQKLFGLGQMDRIKRHRLSYDQLIEVQERTLPKLVKSAKAGGILNRRIMLNPVLHLAFGTDEDATIAAEQHLCLCRNEDLVWPSQPMVMPEEKFEALPGFEYFPKTEMEHGIFHGWDRTLVDEAGYHQKQYGIITRVGEPMRLGEIFEMGKTDNTAS